MGSVSKDLLFLQRTAPKFILDPSLVLYLPLYELDGASFASKDKYGHLCTVTNGIWGVQGITFAGTGWIDLGDKDLFSFTDGVNDLPFTLEAWVNLTDATSSCIMSKNYYLTNVREWFFSTAGDDSLSIYCNNFDSSSIFITRNIAGATITALEGKWIHVVATYDASKLNTGLLVYLNGVAMGTAGGAGTYTGMTNGTEPLYLGVYNRTDCPFKGIMGEVRIYRGKALNPSEIMYNYLSTKGRY